MFWKFRFDLCMMMGLRLLRGKTVLLVNTVRGICKKIGYLASHRQRGSFMCRTKFYSSIFPKRIFTISKKPFKRLIQRRMV